jgi:hypothetical protein
LEFLRKDFETNIKNHPCQAVYGYHVDRVEETSNLIDALLRNGADPSLHDESGETAAHLSVKLTRDFKIMSKVQRVKIKDIFR